MPTITLRVDEKQLEDIQKMASGEYMTINDFVLNRIFETPITNNDKLSVAKVIKIALKEDVGSEFSIPSLFSLSEWKGFDSTEKRMVGRTFFKLVNDEENSLFNEIEFIGKKSNIATYRRY